MPCAPASSLRRQPALDLRLADRQVAQRRGQRQQRVGVPHPQVAALLRNGQAAQPGAEEAADLVRQQRQAEQRGQVTRAEQLAHHARGRRHGSQPGEAQADGKQIERQRSLGSEQEQHHQHRARKIHPEQDEIVNDSYVLKKDKIISIIPPIGGG